MSRVHGSKVAAEITSISEIERESVRVTITLDWTKADQIDMNRPPFYAAFGDDFMTMTESDALGDMGYREVPTESITMQLLRAAWYTAQIECE
jgi:hypothetical protein